MTTPSFAYVMAIKFARCILEYADTTSWTWDVNKFWSSLKWKMTVSRFLTKLAWLNILGNVLMLYSTVVVALRKVIFSLIYLRKRLLLWTVTHCKELTWDRTEIWYVDHNVLRRLTRKGKQETFSSRWVESFTKKCQEKIFSISFYTFIISGLSRVLYVYRRR